MDQQPVKSEPKINGVAAKRMLLTQEMIEGMDHVYRSNPYPSKLEFETLCRDLLVSIGQAKNWFCNRRRRDFKEGKICRRCRFFKAPINEEAHLIYGSRPCISYWKLPTVAPPALLQITLPMTSDNLSPSLDEGVDRQQEQQNIKPDIDENLPTDYSADTDASSVVPTAFSLTFQPGTYNFQQPIFNSEPSVWYQQHHDEQHWFDMAAGNSCMMHPIGTGQSSFWPIPFSDYSPTPDLPQMNQPRSSDWRLNQVQPLWPNYSMSYPSNPHYMYPDPTGIYNYNEQSGTSNY